MPDRLKVRNILSYGILKCTNKDDILRSEPDYYEVVVHHWRYGLNCMKRSPKFTLFVKDDSPLFSDYYLNSFDVNAYQHNMLFNFSSLKPAVYWRGKGNVELDHFQYSELQ